jgi:ribosome-associated toxin RatA of RatAB toxin-antitoxin module
VSVRVGHGSRRGSRWLAWALALLPALASAAADAVVDRHDDVLYVTAWVHAPAPASACYEVLTDFEHLPEFVPGMRSSRVVSQPGEMLRVEQVGVTGPALFGITVRTTLGLSLAAPAPGIDGRIDFSSLGGNLRQMHGAWQIRDDKTGCRIDYRATIEPDFPVPPLLGTLVMRMQIEGQLDAIAQEVRRRQAARGVEPVEVQPLR